MLFFLYLMMIDEVYAILAFVIDDVVQLSMVCFYGNYYYWSIPVQMGA